MKTETLTQNQKERIAKNIALVLLEAWKKQSLEREVKAVADKTDVSGDSSVHR